MREIEYKLEKIYESILYAPSFKRFWDHYIHAPSLEHLCFGMH
jgi:hypothetical protein